MHAIKRLMDIFNRKSKSTEQDTSNLIDDSILAQQAQLLYEDDLKSGEERLAPNIEEMEVLSHISFDYEKLCDIYLRVSYMHIQRKEFTKADQWCSKAYEWANTYNVLNNLTLTRCIKRRGDIKRLEGDLSRALENYSQSLEVKNKAYDIDNEETINSARIIGHIYYLQGKYDKALAQYSMIIENRSLWLKNERDEIITKDFASAGFACIKLGKFSSALENFQRSLHLSLMIDREDLAAVSYNHIASTYDDQGEYSKAIDSYNELLISSKLDDNHPIFGETYNNMAIVHCHQGNFDQASTLISKALEIFLPKLDKHHPHIALVKKNLALIVSYQQSQDHSANKSSDIAIHDLAKILQNNPENYRTSLQ
ncbi:uncharacterized protein TRIADDRAFT_62507 [Trichoplax adhaerens]|uniref:Uncharacterized protein n=1 Tax=Trichoplax adhaerens TaxID=10228 RepID=B3SE04_TRIAD|nr:hypothetical protein TRIADDRAFT_62507 [Trichoplax adhaerens]EDV19040.1 hypothetical protein TRIADDRAFT_62507 [Trichoplax adhaerens]|eukprot:XP_002118471.1 hypothetical protein TRIADDRAFT_62507 [Trichoplax adhaerens]